MEDPNIDLEKWVPKTQTSVQEKTQDETLQPVVPDSVSQDSEPAQDALGVPNSEVPKELEIELDTK